MGMSNRDRQAAFRGRQRETPADALGEIEALRARVEILQREQDRLDDMVGFMLKREE